MNKINLTKYGFIRSQEDDFSDDGSKFTCYRVGRIRVSKTNWQDQTFIAGRIDRGNLDYEEYSKLPHYKNMDKLNGTSIAALTDDDIKEFYDACIAYEKEYTEAESKIVYPSVEAIAEKRRQIRELRQKEFNEIVALTTVEKILNLDRWDLENFKSCYETLKNKAFPTGSDLEYGKQLFGSAYSRGFVNNDYELQPDYYYKRLKELLAK